MQRRNLWIAIILAGLGWGTGSVATRGALLEGVPPFLLIALRFLLATALLAAWLAARGATPHDRAAWRAGAVLGVVNMAVPTVFFTLSLQHLSASIGGLLIALVPLATALWAHVLIDAEPLSAPKVLGMIIALGGVAVLLLSGDTGIPDGGNIVLGVSLSLTGITLAALGGTLTRLSAERFPVTDLALPQFVTAAALATLFVPVTGQATAVTELTGAGWAWIAYLAAASTVIPFVGFLVASRLSSATTASLIGYLVPLVGVTGGVLLLGEHLTPAIIAGGVLILTGVVVVERTERLRATPLAAP